MSDTPLEILTFTRGQTLCRCQRLHYYRYELCIRPKVEPDAESRIIGTALHAGAAAYSDDGLEAGLNAITQWRRGLDVIGDAINKADERAAKARAMLRMLDLRWPRDTSSHERAEFVVSMAILNPDTGASSRTFRYAGKLDKLEGDRLIDWKGVGDAGDFVRKIVRSFQLECYAAALAEQGVTVTAAEFRLITFPTIRLCGKDAGAASYEERCLNWLKDDPTNVATHEIFLNPGRIAMARAWLWDLSKQILECRRCGRWMKNGLACRDWNRVCEYDGLCTIDDQGGDVESAIAWGFDTVEPNPELKEEQPAC
jgi:hypothetical protein